MTPQAYRKEKNRPEVKIEDEYFKEFKKGNLKISCDIQKDLDDFFAFVVYNGLQFDKLPKLNPNIAYFYSTESHTIIESVQYSTHLFTFPFFCISETRRIKI